MKRKFILCFLILISVFCFVGNLDNSVKADEVKDRYEIEIDSKKVDLPPILLGEGKKYTIDVFSKTDTNYESPLATGVTKYKFTSVGEYVLVYHVFNEAQNTQEDYYVSLFVVDTTAPRLELEFDLPSTIYIKEEFILPKVLVVDNSGATIEDYTIKIVFNGTDVSNLVKEGKLKVKEEGDYEISYSAKDASNNEVVISQTVKATKKPAEANKGGNTVLFIVLSVVGGVLICGVIVFFIVRKKKNERKKN